jgi:hypothetical protein
MKTTLFLVVSLILLFVFSCTSPKEESTAVKIENTLKSVSLWSDSLMIDPKELMASLERINEAIDSIGYPDAGYKLWLVKSDSALDFRFMIEGYWPDQAIYDTIHNHELYKQATKRADEEDKFWESLINTWYNRFTRVK